MAISCFVFPPGFVCGAGLERITEQEFGKLANGGPVTMYTLRNSHGMRVKVITYGAIVTEILVPDSRGNMTNVVLGADSLEGYLKGAPAAAVIGRVANRVAKARFTLDGKEYRLAANAGEHHIHGGKVGFDKKLWQGKALPVGNHEASVELTYLSKDGEEGYPGNLTVHVTYTLTDDNELVITYTATTDKATPVNLTNHAYFNLAGGGDVLDEILFLPSMSYTLGDEQLIPTGKFGEVKGTPLDFTKPTRIGERIEQLKPKPGGYDHNFVVMHGSKSLSLAGRVTDPKSGRVLEVRTTEPGVQLYTANHLQHRAVCLETQHYPDSINHPEFPSTVLRPGENFKSTTVWAFSH
jgi:aldose 1-epimerase